MMCDYFNGKCTDCPFEFCRDDDLMTDEEMQAPPIYKVILAKPPDAVETVRVPHFTELYYKPVPLWGR